jgi:tRNA (guanosine-2'-O-)-methyltransferase
VRQLNGTGLKRLHRSWRQRPLPRLGVLLESVQSPANVGSVIRTAASWRVDHLWCVAGATTPANARVGKTALGTDRYLPWTEHEDLASGLAAVRADGYRLVGLELADEAEAITAADLSGDVCLAVGHEDRGLSKDLLDACDQVVYLPQLGRVGSLNVAVAAAVALWELRRRSWDTAPS